MTGPNQTFYTDEHPSETMMRAARALVDGNGRLDQQTGAALAELLAHCSSLTRGYSPDNFQFIAPYTKVAKAVLSE